MLDIKFKDENRSFTAKCNICTGTEEGSTDTPENAEAMVRTAMKKHENCSPSIHVAVEQGDE